MAPACSPVLDLSSPYDNCGLLPSRAFLKAATYTAALLSAPPHLGGGGEGEAGGLALKALGQTISGEILQGDESCSHWVLHSWADLSPSGLC